MDLKNIFILIILVSAGFFPADIFLFAQNDSVQKQLKEAEGLILNKKTDSSFILLKDILKDTLKLNENNKAELYYLLTKFYGLKNKEEIEFSYNKKAEILFRKLKNEDRLCDILYDKFDLLTTQANLSVTKDAKLFLDEFYQLSLKNKNHKNLIKAYKGFAKLELTKKEYPEALAYYNKAINEAKNINDTLSYADMLNNKGLLISYLYKKQDSARFLYNEALNLFKRIRNKDAVFTTNLNIGLSYIRENRLNQALKWYKKADKIQLKEYKNNNKMLLYGQMTNTYEQLKDYKNALDYVWLYNDYKDSVDIKAQNIAISDINIKYKSLEKEKENIELKAANKKKQLYLIGTIGTALAMSIFGFLAYKDIKRKKEIADKNRAIAHQKVVSLVKDQELLSIDAMIEGQEKERIKIAEDLHDNLGSTLATLKLHFDNYRDNLSVNNEKQIRLLDSTENILNLAYSKVRSMAHANHASVLAEHSLVEAVRSLAFNITSANKTEIEVIDFGFEKSLNHTIEITMFRVIQELITNIIKHASAKKGTIDLTLFDDSLGLIVEDDGVGFVIEDLGTKVKGMGLNSIRNRIEKLNGTFAIDTNLGVGTTILIDIPIKSEI